jgi:hypothetical protein
MTIVASTSSSTPPSIRAGFDSPGRTPSSLPSSEVRALALLGTLGLPGTLGLLGTLGLPGRNLDTTLSSRPDAGVSCWVMGQTLRSAWLPLRPSSVSRR